VFVCHAWIASYEQYIFLFLDAYLEESIVPASETESLSGKAWYKEEVL